MNVSHLAVIVPVDGLPQDMEEASQEVWGTVTHLLLPHLGKCYAKFYPARKAWGYRVPETFGVVLGKITPDRFLRLYFEACQAQAAAIHFHVTELVKTVDPCMLEKAMEEDAPFCTVVVDSSDPAQTTHALWQIALHESALLPDCGVYYVKTGKALASQKEQEAILSNVAGYALCMVTLELMEEDDG